MKLIRTNALIPTLASLTAAMALSGAWQGAHAQGSADLAGGWIVNTWTSADGEVNERAQRGLFVFTANGNYSIMYVPGTEPRAEYSGETQTEAEVLDAYRTFVANSGRYTVTGSRLAYEAYMAKDPNYMASFSAADRTNAVNVEFSIANGILTLEWLDGFSAGQKATLRRAGQPRTD